MPEYKESNIIVKTRNNGHGVLLIIVLLIIAVICGIFIYRYLQRPVAVTEITEEEFVQPIQSHDANHIFSDGLKTPNSEIKYELDEFGEGLASIEIFNIDINSDGKKDKITRSRHENGTDHFYYEYKIELNTSYGFKDITPRDFRTIEGAECSLQKIRFIFIPRFQIEKISRQWYESWVTPTMATKSVYRLLDNEIKIVMSQQLKEICDVSELF